MFASNEKISNCFIIVPSSTIASCLPEYSSIIASWIIVSSRCVAGLSTGMRPVSAIAIIKSAAKASI